MKNRIENYLFKIAMFFGFIKYLKVYVPKEADTLNEAVKTIRPNNMIGPKPSWFNRYYIAVEGYHETSGIVIMPPYTGIYLEDGAWLVGKQGQHTFFNKPPEDAFLKMGEIGKRP